jgi:hypothetical protein
MNQELVYHQLRQALGRHLNKANQWQIDNQALMTQALVFSPDCHLPNLALYCPVEGQRENVVQRLRRWLKNEKATQAVCYSPLVMHLLRHWPGAEVGLVMDRTDLGQTWSILMVSLAYRHRSLPLAWRVQPFGATGYGLQEELLRQITPALAPLSSRRITLYGDSEFRAVDLQRYCRDQGWHWYLGLKSDILYCQWPADWQPLSAITIKPGERRYLHNVFLTQRHAFGPVHLLVDWTQAHDKPRYFVSDQMTSRHTWRRGRKRFWIEPTFRDWKSYGFELEKSKLHCPHRLTMLLLNMATASLWLTSVGQWLKITGRDSWLEAEHKRDYSIFRLGRDYARRSLVCGWPLPIDFAMRH